MKLVLWRCPGCSAALSPGDDDLIVACAQCGAGVQLNDEGLEPIEVRYAIGSARSKAEVWQPWWVFTGQVEIIQRDTQSGNQRDEASKFWAWAKHLYVPAWELSLQAMREQGLALLKQQPQWQAVPRPAAAQLMPVVVSVADARKLLDYLVVTLEASRSDWLKDIQFTINVGEPELWAVAS